ncbi:MAG: N-acetyltransferase [Bacteroidia bacterium]|nr:N-acetyltransferase [Bacteroidia bacterium]
MYQPINQRQQEVRTMKALLKRSKSFSLWTRAGKFQGYEFIPSELTKEEKDTLFRAVYLVAINAFVQNPSVEMEQDIYDHLFNEDKLYIVLNGYVGWGFGVPREIENIKVISFLSTRDIQTSVGKMLYLSGICVDFAYQGKGIGQGLMKHSMQGEYTLYSLRTQNPVMQESFDRALGKHSFPNSVETPNEVLNIGQELADMLKTKEYLKDQMLCKNQYGGSLYGIQPDSETDHYSNKYRQINRYKGDSLLCVSMK